MYYSYVEIKYVATRFSPARMDLALKLLTITSPFTVPSPGKLSHHSPAPGKPPFFHHCYNDNDNFGGNKDDDNLCGRDNDGNDSDDAPPSHPP